MLRTDPLIRRAAMAAGALVLGACSSAGSGYADVGTGGQAGAGATHASGEATGSAPSAAGGMPISSAPSSGAPAATGGVGASGNAPPIGSGPTGGDSSTGQPQATGGSPAATGGVPAATGGTVATGGNPATGGAGGCDSGELGTSLPDCQVEPLPSTGDYHQDCVNEINQFRWQCQCLPPLERWPEGEACADQMAQYDYQNNVAHGGVMANLCFIMVIYSKYKGHQYQGQCPISSIYVAILSL